MFFKNRKKEPTVAHLYYKNETEGDIVNYSLTEPAQSSNEKPNVCRTTAYRVYAEKSKDQSKEK